MALVHPSKVDTQGLVDRDTGTLGGCFAGGGWARHFHGVIANHMGRCGPFEFNIRLTDISSHEDI